MGDFKLNTIEEALKDFKEGKFVMKKVILTLFVLK